jgi:transposase
LTLTPLRARAPRGERAVGRIPRGRWQQVTLVGTLTSTGPGPALVIEGSTDRDVFETFVAECLVPHLQPGQTVVLDNLSVHKSAPARRLIEAAGCSLCFLPRYSPDFNPIEQAFAKIKTALRQAEARTLETLVPATGRALAAITDQDAAGFFAEAGFPLTGHYL